HTRWPRDWSSDVCSSDLFYLGKHEVTRGQFRKFADAEGYETEAEKAGDKSTWKKNESFTQTDDHPVINVSWNDARAFCTWLSKRSEERRVGKEGSARGGR